MAEKEYIEREALMTEHERYITEHPEVNLWTWSARLIFNAPAADVRPVVLCRDCKWTKADGMEDPAIYCEKWDRWEIPPDGFCWLGEKREKNGCMTNL